jgi:hypothetical protein
LSGSPRPSSLFHSYSVTWATGLLATDQELFYLCDACLAHKLTGDSARGASAKPKIKEKLASPNTKIPLMRHLLPAQ